MAAMANVGTGAVERERSRERLRKDKKDKGDSATASSSGAPPPPPPPPSPPAAIEEEPRGQKVKLHAEENPVLKKQREEILKPPEPVPAVPVILPINNPAQKEPPISGSDPAAQPVGPAALPNPLPPIGKEPTPK